MQARAEIGKMCRAGSGGQAEAGRSGRRAGTSGPEAGQGESAEIGRKQAGSGRRAGTSGPEAGRGERAEISRKQAGSGRRA